MLFELGDGVCVDTTVTVADVADVDDGVSESVVAASAALEDQINAAGLSAELSDGPPSRLPWHSRGNLGSKSASVSKIYLKGPEEPTWVELTA